MEGTDGSGLTPSGEAARLNFMGWFEAEQEKLAVIAKNHAEVIASRAWDAGRRSVVKASAPTHEQHPPMDHYLKCHPGPFAMVRDGLKGFVYRKFDRPYQVGDRLILQEWDPKTKGYTLEKEIRPIEGMLTNEFGIPADHCILFWRMASPASPATEREPEQPSPCNTQVTAGEERNIG